jgi:hypothetical protein
MSPLTWWRCMAKVQGPEELDRYLAFVDEDIVEEAESKSFTHLLPRMMNQAMPAIEKQFASGEHPEALLECINLCFLCDAPVPKWGQEEFRRGNIGPMPNVRYWGRADMARACHFVR